MTTIAFSIISSIIFGVISLTYCAFVVYTIYNFVIGTLENNATTKGKFLYYHGLAWITVMTLAVAGGLAFIFISALKTFIQG